MLVQILHLVGVGLLWGATNPFIRLGSKGIEKIDTGCKWRDWIEEFRTIGSRLNYWIPFFLNQLGSALFVWTLESTAITIAVPVANSLSFVFTAVTGTLIGEKIPGKDVITGTILVCVGTTFMIYDKILYAQPTIDMEFQENK